MIDVLNKLNVNFDILSEPMLHYVINSELSEDDVIDLEDCAIYVTKDGIVKVLIPNFHTVTSCDYFFEKYPDLYFSRPDSSNIASMNEVFLEGEYGFITERNTDAKENL